VVVVVVLTYRSTRFGVMFLCFDVVCVLGGLLELLALGFLGCELAGHCGGGSICFFLAMYEAWIVV
jgi:hypothetical protein